MILHLRCTEALLFLRTRTAADPQVRAVPTAALHAASPSLVRVRRVVHTGGATVEAVAGLRATGGVVRRLTRRRRVHVDRDESTQFEVEEGPD